MKKGVIDYLEATAEKFPNKKAFVDSETEICYSDFVVKARIVGSCLKEKQRVAIFIDKSINCLIAMFGSAYSNACYSVLDIRSPKKRINTILSKFRPDCIIVDKSSQSIAESNNFDNIFTLEDALNEKVQNRKLLDIRERMVDTDPLYVLFTSGSTGEPKGTVVCHRSVIDYTNAICETFDINHQTIWGSQTPFYFSMSVLDVFSTIVTGATLCLIPKLYFSFPELLIDYLNSQMVNSIYWVPTAFGIIADFDAFSECKPLYFKTILFAGEVMPVKKLNYWKKHLPKCLYANLYGPTEITDTCTYYIVNREFSDCETLPIGNSFDNCDVFVINEHDELVSSPEDGEGELYVRGSFLGLGYYNDSEKTNAVYVQNPLNKYYPEIVYRTGDLVCYNEHYELLYKGRKDFQIKHMGHRIELGEIEASALSMEGISQVACIYNENERHIVLFYSGFETEEKMISHLKTTVPVYMMPQEIKRIDTFPINRNGKIDRIKLKELLYHERVN